MTLNIRENPKTPSSIKLSGSALRVLEKRYLKKDTYGNVVETPEEMFRRVAKAIATAELNYDRDADIGEKEEEFYKLMAGLEFLPNSPTLLNAGRQQGQLSSCFAVPIEDSIESIFNAVKYTAVIQKSGGGTGFSYSKLRPARTLGESAGGIVGGPVSFLAVFSTTTDAVKQGGIRRGCNIGVLSVNHPDILKFITAKDDPNALTNFCLAVAVTNDFMEAVRAGDDYDLVDPQVNTVVGKLSAREVFNRIVIQSWKTGDPGMIFIDRINQDNPTPHLGRIEHVSGCAEQPLLPYESCVLGSINLTRMLTTIAGTAEVDYLKLGQTVRLAVNFLDNIIDINKFPLPQVEEITRKTRKIGLGVMGFADMLIQLGVPYDSEEALKVAADVGRFINEEARQASEVLASKRGVFPAFKGSKFDVAGGYRPRNATRTTIAPTGTLSLIAGCSHSIEPHYAMVYVRNILEGEQWLEVNPRFEEVAKKNGFYSDELLKQLIAGKGLDTLECVPDRVKRLFVTTHRIKPEWHVKMQATFQSYTDNAVSKMINLPQQANQEDIANIFMMAYEYGLKGVTNYRDGSREIQSLCTNEVGLDLVCKYISDNDNYSD
jgi:ribonucleoside-diphosphate reductase alpha chain